MNGLQRKYGYLMFHKLSRGEVNGLQGYLIFHKFEGENFDNWPTICQCFLPPMLSNIQYIFSCNCCCTPMTDYDSDNSRVTS